MMDDLNLEAVCAAMAAEEPVGLPEGFAAHAPAADDGGDFMPPAPPDRPGPDDPPPPEARCAMLPLNDVGNGQRFVLHFGEDAMWVPRVGWFRWDGTRWAKDEDEIEVRKLAQALGPLISREIPHVALEDWQMQILGRERGLKDAMREAEAGARGDGPEAEAARAELDRLDGQMRQVDAVKKILGSRRKEHHGFARTSGNTARVDAMLKEGGTNIAVPFEALDAAPLDIACETGVLRFSVTRGEGFSPVADMALVPHDRAQRITKRMPVEWQPDARAPLFEAFLARVQPDIEMRAFLQRWFGLSMTALTGEQKLVFLHGMGANGKSVLVDLMARLLGDYASTAKIESLTGRNRRGGGDATPDLVPLMGARMVRASEPEEGERLQEGIIKELTGGEPILIRALHSDFIEARPVFKLTISGNHRPVIHGTDDGIWRRVLLVPFDVQIPQAERDAEMGEKLWAERAGILNWLAEGLVSYLEGGLREPATVLQATSDYREESDPMGHFLSTACVVTGEAEDGLLARDLVQAFQFWLAERGEAVWTDGTVSRRLKDKSLRWRSPATGRQFTQRKSSGIMRYDGLRLEDVFGRRFRDAPRDSAGRPIAGKEAVDDRY